MDLDAVVARTLKKMAGDYELRKSFYLAAVHSSLDTLLAGSSVWFGDHVPAEFQSAVSNLMDISVAYSNQIQDFNDFIFGRDRELIDLDLFLSDAIAAVAPLSSPAHITVSAAPGIRIYVPAAVFRDTLLNLLVCVLQFGISGSSISVRAEHAATSIRIRIEADGLSEELPDLPSLMKPILVLDNGDGYRFRIGLELPLYDLKKIGAVTDIGIRNGGSGLSITASFPSYEFLLSIEDIRHAASPDTLSANSGEIIVSVGDSLVALVLKEKLTELGYTVRSCSGERLRYIPPDSYKAMIIDVDKIIRGDITEKDFPDGATRRVIIICGESDVDICGGSGFRVVTMPFEIETVAHYIESV